MIFAELPKISGAEDHKKLLNWLYYLKTEGREDKMLETLIKDDNALLKAHDQYVKFTNTGELRDLYEARKKYEITHLTEIDEARNEGLREGLREGKLEGEQTGLLKGKFEGKLEDARLMKKKGIDINLISEISGLSVKEIEEL
jgi:predicted transposase/invertase (TIGR01784 family)